MVPLLARADIRRWLALGGGRKAIGVWRSQVPCLVSPISQFDQLPPYARESTVVIFIPRWLIGVRKDDQVWVGARADVDGNRVPVKYVVDGIRSYRFGLRHVELFCKEES